MDINNEHSQGEQAGRPRLFSLTFLFVIASALLAFLVGQGVNSGSTVVLEKTEQGIDVGTIAGIGTGMFFAASAITRPIAGVITDKKSRRIAIIVGFGLYIIGCIGPFISNAFIPFCIWRAFQGAAYGFVTNGAGAAAADSVPKSRLSEGLGYFGLGQGLAMAVGPAFALWLAGTDPATNMYMGLLLMAFMGLACGIALKYEKHPEVLPEDAAYRLLAESSDSVECEEAGDALVCTRVEKKHSGSVIRNLLCDAFVREALPGAIPCAFVNWLFAFGITFVGAMGMNLGIENSAMFFTFAAASIIAIRLLSGVIMSRALPFTLFSIAIASGIASLGILLAVYWFPDNATNSALFIVAGIPYGVCSGLVFPVSQSMSVKYSPQEKWGAATATYELTGDICMFIGCFIAGWLVGAVGENAAMSLIIAVLIVAWALALIMYPRADRIRS